jgi:hypothetical protein
MYEILGRDGRKRACEKCGITIRNAMLGDPVRRLCWNETKCVERAEKKAMKAAKAGKVTNGQNTQT